MSVEYDDAKCVKETAKAILVEAKDLPGGQLWIPKSVLHEDSEVNEEGDEGRVVIKTWWAEDNGLE
jgi:hypothetical protein